MNVTLPDGRVLEGIPEGTTKAQIVEKLKANGHDVAGLEDRPTSQPSGSMLKDAALGALSAPVRVNSALEQLPTPVNVAGRVLKRALGIEQPINDINQKFSETPDSTAGRVGSFVGDVGMSFALPGGIVPQVLGNTALGAALAAPGHEATGAAFGAVGGAAGPVLAKALRMFGAGAAHTLGMTTGTGSESVKQAFKGGEGFAENMRGAIPASDVVDSARMGVQTMRKQMQEAYKANKEVWTAGQQPLDITPVKNAYDEVAKSFRFADMSKVGPAEQKVLEEAKTVLQQFAAKPEWHTTEGFDALKQRLSAIYPESPVHRQAQRAIATMVGEVKNTIQRQNPTYAAAMKDYWSRSAHLDEIERSLSLGDRATTDTALRKLQSLVRNNVNSNFGSRLLSAEALAGEGGVDVLPAIAGQAMNSFTPRGLQGIAASGTGIAGLVSNPAALAALPAYSPRMVGEAAHAAGRAYYSPSTQATLDALRRTLPASIRTQRDER